jgi:hypothetical protein
MLIDTEYLNMLTLNKGRTNLDIQNSGPNGGPQRPPSSFPDFENINKPQANSQWVLYDADNNIHLYHATYQDAFDALKKALLPFSKDPVKYKTLIEEFLIMKLCSYVEVEVVISDSITKSGFSNKIIELFKQAKSKILIRNVE